MSKVQDFDKCGRCRCGQCPAPIRVHPHPLWRHLFSGITKNSLASLAKIAKVHTVFVIVCRLPPPPLSDDVICERSLSMCYLYETSRRLRISGVFVTPVRRATLFIQTFHAMFHHFGVLFNLKWIIYLEDARLLNFCFQEKSNETSFISM